MKHKTVIVERDPVFGETEVADETPKQCAWCYSPTYERNSCVVSAHGVSAHGVSKILCNDCVAGLKIAVKDFANS